MHCTYTSFSVVYWFCSHFHVHNPHMLLFCFFRFHQQKMSIMVQIFIYTLHYIPFFCKRLKKNPLKVPFHNFHLLFHFDSLNFVLFFISFQFTVHIKSILNISCFLYYSPFPFPFPLSLHFTISFLSKHKKFLSLSGYNKFRCFLSPYCYCFLFPFPFLLKLRF